MILEFEYGMGANIVDLIKISGKMHCPLLKDLIYSSGLRQNKIDLEKLSCIMFLYFKKLFRKEEDEDGKEKSFIGYCDGIRRHGGNGGGHHQSGHGGGHH